MNLISIQKKLMKQNRKNNMLFMISIIFSMILFTSQGVLQFSRTITSILMTDGSTYTITLGMYGISAAGLLFFLIYANAIYFKTKSRQLGIFLSLGVRQNQCGRMFMTEFSLIYIRAAIIGFVLSIPFSYLVWNLLSAFIKTTSIRFYIGWRGIIYSAVFFFACFVLLSVINMHTIKNMDVMSILRSDAKNELVRGNKGFLGVAGIFMIIVGIILFNISAASGTWFKMLMIPFLIVALVGIYFLAIYVTFIGDVIRKINKKMYLKNILLFNLMKQKGHQYAVSIFVSSLLIFVTIFGVCFNSASFLEATTLIRRVPYDFSVLSNYQTSALNQQKIEELAQKDGVTLENFQTLSLLIVSRKYEYKSGNTEWGPCFVTSQNDYNKLTGRKTEIPQGSFLAFSDDAMGNGILDTYSSKENQFYNDSSKQDFSLMLQSKVSEDGIINANGSIYEFIVVNEIDYKKLETTLEGKYHLQYFLFNGDVGGAREINLQKSLLKEILKESDGKMMINLINAVSNDKNKENGVETINSEKVLSYEKNKLYGARWWELFPFSRGSARSTQFEVFAVYLLFVFYICVITIISAVMIMSAKVISTFWQDQKSYQIAGSIGMKEKDIRKLVNRQIQFIYFTPVIIGCLTAVLMVNRFMSVSSIQSLKKVTTASVIYSIILFLVQTVGYHIVSRKVSSLVED